MTSHPHDREIVAKDTADRVRFEETFLRLTASGRVENLLDALDVSQAELARRLGKSPAWVSKALSGRQNLTLDSLARIGFALGVRWDPEMLVAPREGTMAEGDGPLPAWVRAENAITFEPPDFVGSLEGFGRLSDPPHQTILMDLVSSAVVGSTSFVVKWVTEGEIPVHTFESTDDPVGFATIVSERWVARTSQGVPDDSQI